MAPNTLRLFLVTLVLQFVTCLVKGNPNATVITSLGKIIGFEDEVLIDGTSFPVTKFLGVPYAENMGGENRFEKPIPKAPFKTSYQATEFPASCFQISAKKINVSEDCLYLNIYLPEKLSEVHSVPVMIWIHGGAYLVGAGSLYKAEALSVFGKVIVVTINYRLEMFGFLRTNDGKLIGNQGLWDQQLAIQWVNKHIYSFGGNPDEVTIFGESAGSASVLLQSLYPINKGLFKRVIAESGSPLSDWAIREPLGDKLIEAVGCSSERDPILCLKRKNPYSLELEGYELKYAPSVDGEFLVESPHDIIYGNNSVSEEATAFFASLHIITGVNNFDGALDFTALWPFVLHEVFPDITVNRTQFLELVVPTIASSFKPKCDLGRQELEEAIAFQYTDWEDPNNDTRTRDMVVSLSSDVTFFTGAIEIVQAHSKFHQGHTYMYEFAVKPTKHALPTPPWIEGANHADEIGYVFGYPVSNAYPKKLNYSSDEKILSRAMMTFWTNFAKSSDPNQPGDAKQYVNTDWPQYNLDSKTYFIFLRKLGPQCVKHNFLPERMSFWLNHVPNILRLSCPTGRDDTLTFSRNHVTEPH